MNAQQLMQPKYRLVAIDLDDTLLNKDLKISPRTKRTLSRHGSSGRR